MLSQTRVKDSRHSSNGARDSRVITRNNHSNFESMRKVAVHQFVRRKTPLSFMTSRTDWTLSCDDKWSSIRANSDAAPRSWSVEQSDGSVCLKDTRTGGFKNDLIDSLTFLYEIPRHNSTLGDKLVREAQSSGPRTIEIRLFSVSHAYDHYLGEWAVTDAVLTPNQTLIQLRRLARQSPILADAYRLRRRVRSQSEGMHHKWLQENLPGWHIRHEPEAAVGLDAPLVQNGALHSFAGDAYTHDYVVASPQGCKRLCIESKANMSGMTEEAKEKCRALRDAALHRVLAVVDHGRNLQVIDFGSPGTQADEETTVSASEMSKLWANLGIVT